MLHIIKRRTIIFTGFLSFIIGCTLTISLMRLDSCENKLIVSDEKKNLDVVPIGNFHKGRSFLVVLILTSPVNRNRRNAIRETWLSLCNSLCNFKYYFVIGSNDLQVGTISSIQQEQALHHDLLLLSKVTDNYSNLTHKVLEAYIWLDKTIEQYDYVLKCDDDSFIQVDKVVSNLKDMPALRKKGLYWGFFNGRAAVKLYGKWREPDWILCDYYLPYALGGGYVLSQKLVHYIAANAEYLRLYNSEDISVGVWLAAVKDVYREHDPRFDTEYVSRGCSNRYLVTHKHDEESMRTMFNSLRSTGNLCVKEYKIRKSYIYNWNVPPSKCCVRNDSNVP